MPKIQATNTTAQPSLIQGHQKEIDNVIGFIKSPNMLILVGIAIMWWLMKDSDSKGKLSSGRWGGATERKASKAIALAQIKNPKKNACSLYINTPPNIRKLIDATNKYALPKPTKKYKQAPTYYFSDTQQSIAVVGSAGSGKTYSIIDPLIRSALDQGHSTILYDFKYPGQAKGLALYAKRRGYQVYIFAPGYEESCALNLLDFIKDSGDAVGAEQLAEVIVKNCTKEGKEDAFFGPAGISLVKGLFLLTKWVDEYLKKGGSTENHADLLTTACLLNLPNLSARLTYAMENQEYNLSRWTMQPLAQLMSLYDPRGAEASKTETSIVATAQNVFEKFIKRDFIGSFCQKSNLELDVDNKVLVILGLNQVNRYSIGPLLAAATHMVVSNNIVHSKPRKSPLIVSLDELPTIFLPALANWLAEARSAGFNAIIGFQNFRQLQELYGENLSKVIFGNAANKVLFNPGEFESAKVISDYIGSEEVTITNKSRSHGKNASTTTSKNTQTKEMLAPNELLKFDRGQGIAILSGSRSKKEAFIPQKNNYVISEEDMAEIGFLEGKWDKWIEGIRKTMPQLTYAQLEIMFTERAKKIASMFPEPPPPPE